MTETQKIISENLKAIRKQKKIYQKDIERKTGLLASTYSRIENMEVVPNLASLEKIADALEVPVIELFKSRDVKDKSLLEKLEMISSLSEYNQQVINIFIESIIEKDNLEKSQQVQMKKRLNELENIRKS